MFSVMNHDYNLPARGAVDWDLLLNENFERLDTDVEIRDAERNLEEYEPKEEAMFLATDTGNAYFGDGEEWKSFSTISRSPTYDQVTTGQIQLASPNGDSNSDSRPLISTQERTIAVGPDSEDDKSSIQAALNEVPIFLRHNYSIEVDPRGGPYENIVVPVVFPLRMADREKGDTTFLRIAGNDGRDAGKGRKAAIQGIYLGNGENGTYIRDIRLVGENPHDNLSSCVTAFSGKGHLLTHIDIGETSAKNAFHAQNGAYLDVRNCDLGEENVAYGLRARGAETTIQARDVSGRARFSAFVGASGDIHVRNCTVQGGDTTYDAQWGTIYDSENRTLYGPERLAGRRD